MYIVHTQHIQDWTSQSHRKMRTSAYRTKVNCGITKRCRLLFQLLETSIKSIRAHSTELFAEKWAIQNDIELIIVRDELLA